MSIAEEAYVCALSRMRLLRAEAWLWPRVQIRSVADKKQFGRSTVTSHPTPATPAPVTSRSLPLSLPVTPGHTPRASPVTPLQGGSRSACAQDSSGPRLAPDASLPLPPVSHHPPRLVSHPCPTHPLSPPLPLPGIPLGPRTPATRTSRPLSTLFSDTSARKSPACSSCPQSPARKRTPPSSRLPCVFTSSPPLHLSHPSRLLQNRALDRLSSSDKAALPPPLKQIDAFLKGPNQSESLSHYLYSRRADLALDDINMSDPDDRDGIGEPSPDDGRDSDEDAIGSEHPKSPSLGPTTSPAGAQRHLDARLPTPSPSSPRQTTGTAGNTTGLFPSSFPITTRVSHPISPTSLQSRTPKHRQCAPSAESGPEEVRVRCCFCFRRSRKWSGMSSHLIASTPPRSNVLFVLQDHSFTGDDRCTNCIMRNNPTCIVNSSRQRCDSCFMKRHRCSKVLTPPTRPSRETKSASTKGKGPGGESRASFVPHNQSPTSVPLCQTHMRMRTERVQARARPSVSALPRRTTPSATSPRRSVLPAPSVPPPRLPPLAQALLRPLLLPFSGPQRRRSLLCRTGMQSHLRATPLRTCPLQRSRLQLRGQRARRPTLRPFLKRGTSTTRKNSRSSLVSLVWFRRPSRSCRTR